MVTNQYRILLASVVVLMSLSACKNKAAVTPSVGGVAATVNGMPIDKDSVDQIVEQRISMGQPDSPEARKAIITQLATQLLISQEAIKLNLDKSPDVVNQMKLIQQSVLANAFVQDYIKRNPMTDDKLKAEYDKLSSQMSGTEYKARHILVSQEADAKRIIAKLKTNVSQFNKLAQEQSSDAGSKGKGGDLGWFDPRSMVPEFGAAVAKLAKGKFTLEPVKTQFGYHVIILDDTRAKQAPGFDQVKPQLAKQVQEQSLKKLIDDLMAKAKIEITAASGVTPSISAKKTE